MVDTRTLPKYIHYINNVERGRRHVHRLLRQNLPDCLPLIIKHSGIPWKRVALIGFEYNGEFFVFDLRACPEMVIDTSFSRLLISPDLVTATHNGWPYLLELAKKKAIITRNLFDTQKAFDCLSRYNEMPCRKISIARLQEKLNMFSSELDMEHEELEEVLETSTFIDCTGLDWNKRPVNNEMLLQVVAEVSALKKCYLGLCTIGDHFADIYDLSNDIPAPTNENSDKALKLHEDDERKSAMAHGIRSGLLDIGQSLLTDTIPVAQLNIIPSYLHDS